MNKLYRNLFRNVSTRLLVITASFITILSVLFCVQYVNQQVKLYEQIQHTKLITLTRTLAFQIDGDNYAKLMLDFPEKDAQITGKSKEFFNEIVGLLNLAQKKNGLKSRIYTLSKNANHFVFGASSVNQIYHHPYLKIPKSLIQNYNVGGIMMPYTTENGIWLSAFSPIKNAKGEAVGVVEADIEYSGYLAQLKRKLYLNVGLSFIVISVFLFFLIGAMKRILDREEKVKEEILRKNEIIDAKNKDHTDSLNYAKNIQDTFLPSMTEMEAVFGEMILFYQPKDIVSGDFYWLHTTESGEIILALGDCTGHGVPGALMSVVGHTLLNEVVKDHKIVEPAKILKAVDNGLNTTFNATKNRNDGMDLIVIHIDAKKTKLTFSGAFRPLSLLRNGEWKVFKGNRLPIGNNNAYAEKTFETNASIDLISGDKFLLCSDGFTDQFGGTSEKKMLPKRLYDLFASTSDFEIHEAQDAIVRYFDKWKGDHPQTDDVALIGFKI